MFGNECNQFVLIRTHHFGHFGTSLVKVKRRHGLDLAVCGDIFGIVDIDLDAFNFWIFGDQFFKDRSDEFARSVQYYVDIVDIQLCPLSDIIE